MTIQPAVWRVSFQQRVEYEIVKCAHLLDARNEALLSRGKRDGARRFVVVDQAIERLHGEDLRGYFDWHHVKARIVALPGGEANKSVENYRRIVDELDAFPIDRRDEPIIAIGGGVLTDLVGFAAGTYRRGVPHIRVPTTLMGYVDAAIGVKTGINFNAHKNRLGAFEPPLMVLLDKAFLQTLPARHIRNGVCEMIKLAMIADLRLFELLERDGRRCIETWFQDERGTQVLDRAVQGMVNELQPNLLEGDLSRRMDFGHTFSYGIETAADSPWLHGEAVLMDVMLSSVLASDRKLLPAADLQRLFGLIARLGIEVSLDALEPDILWQSLQERTLHRNGWQRTPLPHGIGECTFVNDVSLDEVRAAFAGMPALHGG